MHVCNVDMYFTCGTYNLSFEIEDKTLSDAVQYMVKWQLNLRFVINYS